MSLRRGCRTLHLVPCAACLSLLTLVVPACTQLAGRTVEVEFDQEPRIQGGEPVVLDDQRIGTAGKPKPAGGLHQVPVHLDAKHSAGLTGDAVFVVRNDPARPGRVYLVVYPRSESSARDVGTLPHYRGAASDLDLARLLAVRTVAVEFRQAPEAQGGEPVLLDGWPIGTTGKPVLGSGSVSVPVYLDSNYENALPADAVFIVRDDPARPGRTYLVAFALSEGSAGTPDSQPHYRGVVNEVELALLVGANRARRLWETLVK